MPIYEYQCQSCGRRTEKIQKFSDPPLTTCPECSGPLEKLISQTAFVLKGGGWYASGYDKTTKKKSDGKGESKKSSSSSDTKTTGSSSSGDSKKSTGKSD